MNSNIPALQSAYEITFFVIVIVLAIMAIFCLVRAVIGPRITDRIVAVNMIGTMVIVVIAILSVFMEGYLADICLIYAMVSFLAVVVLTKLYTGVYLAAKKRENDSNLSAQNIEEMVRDAAIKEGMKGGSENGSN